jgi:hypothetical protein
MSLASNRFVNDEMSNKINQFGDRAKKLFTTTKDALKNNPLSNTISNVTNSLRGSTNAYGQMNPNINKPLLSSFTNPNFFSFSKVNVPQGFLEANALISKFAFLILILLLFLILLRVGITLLSYYLKPNESPRLINGTVNGKQMIVIPQNPNDSKAKTIYRSVDETAGLEFTWSVWVYIEDLTYQQDMYRHIFHKGNNDLQTSGALTGTNGPNNAPGLYIKPNSNTLVVMMNTFDVINKEIEIPDIPLNKWVNVIIRCHNTTLDVYINGTIARSIELSGVPKQNYGNVYVAMNGGFDGYISNLWYYNYALGTTEIQRIATNGPDTRMSGSNGMNIKDSKYLSMRWFFNGSGGGYNQ